MMNALFGSKKDQKP